MTRPDTIAKFPHQTPRYPRRKFSVYSIESPVPSMAAPMTPPQSPGSVSSSCLTPVKAPSRTNSLPTPPFTPDVTKGELNFHRLSIDSDEWVSTEIVSESKRPLSDNELSYFLPSRADGVNDM